MAELMNPNVFGTASLAGHSRDLALQVLAEGELFRHRGDGMPSWNDRLEHGIATWSGCAGAVATNSGTAGLRIALRAAGVGPGSTVLVSAYTFIATAMAVVSLGAVPEPIDMTPELGIDHADLEKRLRPGVQAVVAVHVQGHLANLRQVRALVAAHNVRLIEDACQAFGATCNGLPAGGVGDLGVFSFQQAKQLAAGEGGMIVSRHPDLVTSCARQVDLGAVRDMAGMPDWDDERAIFGENCRMTELQAAILWAQLDALPAMLSRQREVRCRLRHLLEEEGIRTVHSADPDGDSASHLVLLADSHEHAQQIVDLAMVRGVLVRRIWDRPYYRHGIFKRSGLDPEQLNVPPAASAERLAPRLLSIPLGPSVTPSATGRLAEVIVDVVRAVPGKKE